MPESCVVYTCVTNGYDRVAPVPAEWQARCIMFHDGSVEVPSGWEGRRLEVAKLTGASLNRYAKMLPHRLDLQGSLSLYIDGNLTLRQDPEPFIRAALARADFAAWSHPARDCAYLELRELLRLGFIGPAQAWQHARRFRALGVPRHAGLIEANVLYRRHDAPKTLALDEAWWDLWQHGLMRDQPLLTAAARTIGVTPAILGVNPTRTGGDALLAMAPHATGRPRDERLPRRLRAELSLYRLWT